jgi:hypothetical protein
VARRLAGLSTGPACWNPNPKTELPAKTARCSAALLGIISTASRFAHLPSSPRGGPGSGAASRDRKTISSGASSRLAPTRTRKFSPLPAGGDRSFCRLPHPSCRCRPSGEAGTSVPITKQPCTCAPSRGSEIFGNKPVDNGDIGNNNWNLPESVRWLPIRSPCPTSAKCLNRPR